jgi:hypothetical protein
LTLGLRLSNATPSSGIVIFSAAIASETPRKAVRLRLKNIKSPKYFEFATSAGGD